MERRNHETEQRDHSLISPTAKLVAYMRAFTDIPFAAYIAEVTDSKAAFDKLTGDAAPIMIGFVPMIEQRYRAISDQLRRNGHKRVLALAEGLSPRGLEVTEDSNTHYVVTDLPRALSETQPLLERLAQDRRDNLHFAPANALSYQDMQKAAALLPEGEVAITCEGLVPYFPHSEKRESARNIRRILDSRGGAWYTTDMMTRDRFTGILDMHPSVRRAVEGIMGATGSDLMSNAFVDEDEIYSLYAAEGLRAERIDTDYLVPQISSLNNPQVSREKATQMLKGRPIWKFTAD